MEVLQLTPHVESAGTLEPNRNAALGQVSGSAVQELSKLIEKASLPSGNAPNRPDAGEFTS